MKVLAICALWLAAASSASAQESDTDFVAEPVPGSQMAPSGGYFLLEAAPGQEVRQSIGLRNDGGKPLELQLDAVDATTGQLGGASYGLADEQPARTGAWITLERSTVTLAPGASEIISFQIAVPSDADSGQHLAGISVAAPRQDADTADAGEGQAGASIDVQTRRIIAVQVNLPGPDAPELVIDGIAPVARPDGLYLEIAIENRGRGLTKAEGVLTVGEGFEREFDVDTFIPGTAIAYPIKWVADRSDGEHLAAVELRYGEEVVRWSGTFRVGDEVREELADRQVVAPPEQEGDSGVSTAVLAGGVAAGIALASGGGYAVTRLRRPRGKHAMKRRDNRRARMRK